MRGERELPVSIITWGGRQKRPPALLGTHYGDSFCFIYSRNKWCEVKSCGQKSKLPHMLETLMNQKLQVSGGHVHPLSTHSPHACNTRSAGWRTHQYCLHFQLPAGGQCGYASHQLILMHPNANPNRPCRHLGHVTSREDIPTVSFSFSPHLHHFWRMR